MSLISASGLAKTYGAQLCFRDVEFTLDEGERIGLIGANGSGKTSLFRIMQGILDYDGTLSRQKNLRIGILEQDPNLPEAATVHEAVIAAAGEIASLEKEIASIHLQLETASETAPLLERLSDLQTRFEHADGYEVERRAERLLEGVGLPQIRHGDKVATLSGGERNRVALARLLLVESDLWLLDEPTNHLDLPGIAFLEEFLAKSKASVLVISHDRHFLDAVTTETWELEGERLWIYPAPYTRARDLREERLKAAKRAFEKQQGIIQAEEEFIRRYGAGQRAMQARGRKTRLARVERLENPESIRRAMALNLPRGEPLGAKPPLEVRDLSIDYGKGPLFRDLTFSVEPGETLGVVGPNGAGKTSLLRMLLGEIQPTLGEVVWGAKAERGVLTQHEHFPEDGTTPFKYLRNCEPKRTNQELRDTLGAMLFRGDSSDKPVTALSGGERKRLMLCRLLLEGNNVLLLDEPTNHLDLPSREAVEFALSVFQGSLVVISHDRYFLDQMADRVLWIEDGEWKITLGGYAEAAQARRKTSEEARTAAPAPKPVKKVAPPSPTPAAKKPYSPFSKFETKALEERMLSCQARIEDLNRQHGDKEVYRNKRRLKEVQDALAEAQAELTALETEYAKR